MARPSWSRSRARPAADAAVAAAPASAGRGFRRRRRGRLRTPARRRGAASARGCGPCSGGQPSWSSSLSVQPAVIAARRVWPYARWHSVMCRSAAARASTAASIARAASAMSPIRSTLRLQELARGRRRRGAPVRCVSHALGHGLHAAGGLRTRSRPWAGVRAGHRPEPDRPPDLGRGSKLWPSDRWRGRARLRRATLAEPNRSPAPRARGARREDVAGEEPRPLGGTCSWCDDGQEEGAAAARTGWTSVLGRGVAVGVGAGADHGDGGARGARGECVARAGRSSAGGTPRHRGGVDDARRFGGAGGDGHLPRADGCAAHPAQHRRQPQRRRPARQLDRHAAGGDPAGAGDGGPARCCRSTRYSRRCSRLWTPSVSASPRRRP